LPENWLPEELSTVQQLIGRRCIGFTAGESTGSVVDLEFEPRQARRQPLTNPCLTEDQRNGDPAYAIFIECAWRLDGEREVICGSWDENSLGGTMLSGLQKIVGRKVTSFNLAQPGYDLQLSFEGGLKFTIFCDQVNEDDASDNYSIFSPEQIITIGTKSRLRLEQRTTD
jgi:hypothetical protein